MNRLAVQQKCISYNANLFLFFAGITQLVECQPSKLNVAGSSPVSRSILVRWYSVLNYHDAVAGSSPALGTNPEVVQLVEHVKNGIRFLTKSFFERFGMSKRFWRGKKRLAKKYMGSRAFNEFFKNGLPKIGDLTHDCDGFNHVISQTEVIMYHACAYRWPKPYPKWLKGAAFPFIDCYYDDTYLDAESGEMKPCKRPVCSCGGLNGARPPSTQKEIEDWVLSWKDEKTQEIAGGWGWSEKFDGWIQTLEAGGHIVDERGLLIK